MSEVDFGFEGWKLAVMRAAAYVQSNASFQFQLFGVSASISGVSVALSKDNSNHFIFEYVLPVFLIFVLCISCYYFSRLTVQHVFIRLYGNEYNKAAFIKSADSLWDNLAKQNNVDLIEASRYLICSNSTGPYKIFFFLYGLAAHFLVILVIFNRFGQPGIWLCIMMCLFTIPLSIVMVAHWTTKAWRAIDYEERVKLAACDLLNTEAKFFP